MAVVLEHVAGEPSTRRRAQSGLRIRDVVKVYGTGVRANDGITLDVEPGEIYGLLGPNGPGKSTLVQQVIGLLKPTSGSIALGRFDLVADPDAARQLSTPSGSLTCTKPSLSTT
jgi:ABC-type multidrug transport system ATPase subunit